MATPTAEITGPVQDRYDEVLTPQALQLIGLLHAELGPRRAELLARRRDRTRRLAEGDTLTFLDETRSIREDSSWRVAEPAPGLVDRRVEITGPTERKMAVNALNSGAAVWLADQEDANTPLWDNVVQGQLNLRDAVADRLTHTSPEGKQYGSRRRSGNCRRSSSGPAGGTCPRSTCGSPASPRRAAWSTSRSTSAPAGSSRSTGGRGRTSTCRSSSRISRRACGTTPSCSPRTSSACRAAPSAPPS